jgi:hypothetical protein
MALDLGFLILLAITSAGLGLRLLRVFGSRPEHPSDSLALALPLGLGTLGLGMLGLGECGMLGLTGVLCLFVVAIVAGLPEAFRSTTCRDVRFSFLPHEGGGISGPPIKKREPNGPGWAWGLALGLVLIGTLLTALAPVTDGDALCYHLQVPKVFLASGSVGYDPDLHETVYPLLTEMLYAMALAVRGPVACRLVQWLLGVSFALNVAALARPILGDRAHWAATVALLVPAVSNGMGAPLNDVALAAFGNAALFAFTRWHMRPSLRAATLAGVLAGFALGVKYPALVLSGLIAGAMLLAGNKGVRSRIRDAIAFGLVALAVGGAWYARAYVYTGNPVHPFFRHVFGGSGLDEVLDPIKRPLPANAWNLATALVPMTLDPARFDSVSHQFGPLFLLILPALLWERAPRRVWAIVGIGYAFLVLCLTQRQSMRFVLIAVGPMAVGVAWIASRWWDRRSIPARILIAFLVGCLAFEAMIAVGRARHGLNVVFGRESAASFLTRREPTYRVGRWIDEHLPTAARIVGQDHRGYYIPRAYTMELAHRRRTGLGMHGEPPDVIVAALRRDGFSHLLLCPPEPIDAVEFDPALNRLLSPWLETRSPRYRETIADADGVVRRYAIYALDDSRPENEWEGEVPGISDLVKGEVPR